MLHLHVLFPFYGAADAPLSHRPKIHDLRKKGAALAGRKFAIVCLTKSSQRVPKGALFLYAIKEGIPLDLIVRKIPQSDTIKVYPVSDVHLGSILHDKEGWQAFCRRVEREDAYLILGGDLINNNTRNAVGSPFEDYIRPQEQKKMMV